MVGAAERPKLVAELPRRAKLVVSLAVQKDLGAAVVRVTEPGREETIVGDRPLAVPVRNHEQGRLNAKRRAIAPDPLNGLVVRRRHIVDGHQQFH